MILQNQCVLLTKPQLYNRIFNISSNRKNLATLVYISRYTYLELNALIKANCPIFHLLHSCWKYANSWLCAPYLQISVWFSTSIYYRPTKRAHCLILRLVFIDYWICSENFPIDGKDYLNCNIDCLKTVIQNVEKNHLGL